MKKIFVQRSIGTGLAALALIFGSSGCAVSESQLKAAIEKNPDIVFGAMEKNPDRFAQVIQKASMAAEQKSREARDKEEKDRIENERRDPLKPEIAADRASKGDAGAPITIVEYSDFQCPFCSRGFNTLQQVLKAYPGKIHFIFKNLPLSMHPYAMPAAKRFEAIALQDSAKAYKFHDEVFLHQDQLNGKGEKFLDDAAKKAGADLARMKKDMDSDKVKARIEADMKEASGFGISGTPGFIVSGVSVRGAYPFETFKEIIDGKLKSTQ